MTLTQLEAAEKIAGQTETVGPQVDPLAAVPGDLKDLARAYWALQSKQAHHRRRWRYYEGKHPLVFSTARLQQVFHLANVQFVENWCKIIVNSAADRLQLLRFTVSGDDEDQSTRTPSNETAPAVPDASADPSAKIESLFKRLALGIKSDDVHREADITGEAFLIAWKNGTEPVQVYRQPAAACHMFYKSDMPDEKDFAAKWFDTANRRFVVLYYEDRIETWRSTVQPSDLREFAARQWVPEKATEDGDGWIPNKSGIVPVFHFRLGGFGESELDDAMPIQDMINKLLSDEMVVAEFMAYPMRWAITDQNLEGLKAAPHGIWKFTPGDGEGQASATGQYQAADLSNYIQTIDNLAAALATITSTPKHLFFGADGTLSGEALLALEAPLVNKVKRYAERLGVTWTEFAEFVLKLDGIDVEREQLEPVFGPFQTISPITQAAIRQTNVGAGMPLRSVLRLEGMSDAEIAKIDEDAGLDELVKVKTPEQLQGERDVAIADLTTKLEPFLGELMQNMSQTLVGNMVKSGVLAELITAGQAARKSSTGSEGV